MFVNGGSGAAAQWVLFSFCCCLRFGFQRVVFVCSCDLFKRLIFFSVAVFFFFALRCFVFVILFELGVGNNKKQKKEVVCSVYLSFSYLRFSIVKILRISRENKSVYL